MTYKEWEVHVAKEIRDDSLWKVEAYRLGLFLADLARPDSLKLLKQRLYRDTADQLYRAASYVSSNVAEGFSRSMPNDRARFYEDALGSVRESRDWYHKGRQAFADKVVAHRMDLTKQLISLLITMITNERRRTGRIGKRQGPAE